MSADVGLVAIVDDDPAIRDSLESLFRSVGHETRLFASPGDFFARPVPEGPSCVVLDVRLPGRSGLDVQREMAENGPAMPVVFITGHGDVPMSVSAMKAGAIEFLTKPFREQDLLDAVHRGIALDRDRRREAAELAVLYRRRDELTPREREVMEHVAAGRLNKQIAADLGLSETTVKVHRGQVMRKMGADSLADLVRIADRLG